MLPSVLCSGAATSASVDTLEAVAFDLLRTEGRTAAVPAFERVLSLNASRANAHMQLGLSFLGSSDEHTKESAYQSLERAFAPDVWPQVPMRSMQSAFLTYKIFVYRWKQHNYPRAHMFLEKAEASQRAMGVADTCTAMQLATMLPRYPRTKEDEVLSLKRSTSRMNALLRLRSIDLSRAHHHDKYVFCMLTQFYLSFRYAADFRAHTSKFYRLGVRAFPELVQPGPIGKRPRACPARSTSGRRVRLGVVSAFLSDPTHPVPSDFGATLGRLSPHDFDVVYIHVDEARRLLLYYYYLVY